jgi:hypothetical protein
MRIDSSGNLLVGTTDTTLYNNSGTGDGVAIHDGGYINAASPSIALTLNRLATDGGLIQFRKDGTTVGSIGSHSGFITMGNGDTSLIFDSTANTIEPFNQNDRTSEDAAITLGWSTNRFKDLYLSGGVYLGGTGSANKLDDYEEGTFTPQIADAVSGGNSTTTGNTIAGHYVKVGDLVHVSIRIIYPNTSGLSSGATLYIRNLPFTCYNASGGYPLAVGTARNIDYSYDMITAQIAVGTTYLSLESCRAASLSSPLYEEEITCGQFEGDGTANSPVLYLGGTYRAN